MTIYSDPNSPPSVLRRLRAMAHASITSFDELHQVTRQQATLLGTLLAGPVQHIPDRVSALIPSVRISYAEAIPLAGVTFWARPHWHIHVRASDPPHRRIATVLHELKRIIDHPVRRRLATISSEQWEALAVDFSEAVLANVPKTILVQQKGEIS
ncbi:hypothetical protein ETD83_29480 [Actinomadura soli]|uniref:Uncharacterized protein n=1 Tax=Actinomadura soli TaxID=2508997 RepID=A0A5C4J765_9ACTN|nr:hypothetical protein [Actinomadura soli]TMQ91736.1 hypothetical protein ETD83_29480 [Actinomadura soli]